LFTFLGVSFLWIFFRANSTAEAFYIISQLPKGIGISPVFFKTGLELYISLASLGLLLFIYLIQPPSGYRDMLSQKPPVFRWVIYLLLVLAIMNLGKFKETPFIYGQF
ncbi:MAG TPA: hypothetical protein VK469_05975, partial [Candidatus Kapabacteria bacterium]|nr:hypothetical protein [Candidatus Kapabacteria bacterium]